MKDINNVINNNFNISDDLKDKIIECCKLILIKYPMAYKNLVFNLSTITIRYKNESDNIINEINANSIYDSKTNTIILNKESANGDIYKELIVHELLHVSSFHDNELGFESLSSNHGLSFNEGMTEFLTREIVNSKIGVASYNNDINNVMLLSTIIPIDKLINMYFNDGLLSILQEYVLKIGKDNELRSLIELIDLEHVSRVRYKINSNTYKDQYITTFVRDISKISTKDNNELIMVISTINSFIRGQYNTIKVPNSIKMSIEGSLNTLLNNNIDLQNLKGIK